MLSNILLAAGGLYLVKKIWSLQDSATKLMFSFAGARFKGGKLNTGFSGGNLNIEALFNVSNPGKTTINLEFLMLDVVLEVEGGGKIGITQIRLENLEEKRKTNPNFMSFPSQQTNQLVVPISIPLASLSNIQLIAAIVSGKKITGVTGTGYIMANGIRIAFNETKQFGKVENPKDTQQKI